MCARVGCRSSHSEKKKKRGDCRMNVPPYMWGNRKHLPYLANGTPLAVEPNYNEAIFFCECGIGFSFASCYRSPVQHSGDRNRELKPAVQFSGKDATLHSVLLALQHSHSGLKYVSLVSYSSPWVSRWLCECFGTCVFMLVKCGWEPWCSLSPSCHPCVTFTFCSY